MIYPCYSLVIFQKIFRHQWCHEAFFDFIKFHAGSVKHVYIHHIKDYWLAIPIKINNAQANYWIVSSSVVCQYLHVPLLRIWSIADPPPRHICQPFISTLEQKKEKHSTNSHNASYMWLLCITCFTHLKPPRIAKRITSGSMCLGLSAFMKFVSRYRKKVELWGLESIRRGHL